VILRSLVAAVVVAAPGLAQAPAKSAPSKIAIIQFQAAVLATREGQVAQSALRAKFDPRKNELEKRQSNLKAIQEKLQKGGALAADVRAKLEGELSSGTRSLNNDAEDLNSDVQQEENKLLQGLAQRLGDIIRKYANENGISMVIDVSSQQSSVLWAAPAMNITEAIVKLYDQAHPEKGPAPPPASAKPPAAPPPPAPKPPASKKQ
jgi:outer membrane protein